MSFGRNCKYLSSTAKLRTDNNKDNNSNKDDDQPREVGEFKNPWYILKQGFSGDYKSMEEILPVPRETDIAVIGGGAIGSSVAYFLKQRHPEGFNVHVIERDSSVSWYFVVLHSTLSTLEVVNNYRRGRGWNVPW